MKRKSECIYLYKMESISQYVWVLILICSHINILPTCLCSATCGRSSLNELTNQASYLIAHPFHTVFHSCIIKYSVVTYLFMCGQWMDGSSGLG